MRGSTNSSVTVFFKQDSGKFGRYGLGNSLGKKLDLRPPRELGEGDLDPVATLLN